MVSIDVADSDPFVSSSLPSSGRERILAEERLTGDKLAHSSKRSICDLEPHEIVIPLREIGLEAAVEVKSEGVLEVDVVLPHNHAHRSGRDVSRHVEHVLKQCFSEVSSVEVNVIPHARSFWLRS